LWIQHTDHLHAVPYGAFFGYGSIWFLTGYLRHRRSAWYLLASGLFLFCVFLSSYDYWFFAPLLAALVVFGHERRLNLTAPSLLATLALFAVAAVACKFATNMWVLGGVGPFLTDLRFQALERSRNPLMGFSIA